MPNQSEPLVSVLMPVYNGANFIEKAISSVLNQSHTNFELIIIDDCSSDNTIDIINSFSDSRIRLIKNQINSRTAISLNKAIKVSKGKYLARMDQDDINYVHRFERQVEFLENNLEFGICGTHIENFSDEDNSTFPKFPEFPLTSSEIKLSTLYRPGIVHPTVMIRKSVLQENNLRYQEGIIAEDYSLWIKLFLVTEVGNVPDVLMYHRIHNGSITKNYYSRIYKELPTMRIEYSTKLLKIKKVWAKLLYSRLGWVRRLAIRHISSSQDTFDTQLLSSYMARLDSYLDSTIGTKWVLNRIRNRLGFN